jgi:flagellar biosynthesis/type III secretory pathway chaperone
MEELLDVLGEEEKQYQKLVELGTAKRDAIIKSDIASLDTITMQEQDASSVLLNLSHKRTQVLDDMATVLGKEPGEITITKMIGYLDKQPKEREALTRQRDRLLEVGTQMRTTNEQNEILLKQALEMVEFDLTLLRSMRQAPETANYDKNAYNTGTILGSSGFDAKQ